MTAATATATAVAVPAAGNQAATGGGGGGPFGDTTYTKVFVGGLAWETQKETMKNYFEQFGDILEAVVITDKATGRSKGYGFVTFREAEAARRACVDGAPIIDGRRANCNLASLGVQRSKPSTPKHGVRNSHNYRGGMMNNFQQQQTGGGGATVAAATAFGSTTCFPHYPLQQGVPYPLYAGYSPYSADYSPYHTGGYYNVYGGGNVNGQYAAMYGSTAGGGGGLLSSAAAAFYPYLQMQIGDVTGGGGGGGQYHPHPQFHHLFPSYSPINSTAAFPHQHYATTSISLAPAPPLQSVCFAIPQA